mmetsp:Transcript_2891/g.3052  ORF Transcript_2891/g.3052 Transcript_2891/m.3052 type:complete len:140 (+) Transcript_2891:72-491(+)
MEEKENVSKVSFFATSLGIVSAGALYGLHRQLRVENFKYNQANKGLFLFAAKALLYGTVLCFSTFGVGISTIAISTKTRSLQEFSDLARRKFMNEEYLEDFKLTVEKEKKEIQKLKPADEAAYWSSYFGLSEDSTSSEK